jgi:hypothetical protein
MGFFLCMHGREDETAAALTSGTAFKRKVQATCGNTNPRPVLTACQIRHKAVHVGPVAPRRPPGDVLKQLGNAVFVGTFRGEQDT